MADNNDLLEDVIAHWRGQDVPGFPRDRISSVEKTINASLATPVSTFPRNDRRRRSRLVAATILAAIAIGVLWLIAPWSTQRTFAFEQVQQALGKTRSISYTVTITGWKNQPWPDPYVTKVKMLAPGRVRVERDGELQLTDRDEGRFVLIHHKERKVAVYPLFPLSKGASPSMEDFIEQARNIPASAARKLGERVLDGRAVVEFLWKLDDDECVVAVDAASKLPVRMEINRGIHREKEIREVYGDFVFDAPMDESLFKIAYPAGYVVEERIPDMTRDVYPEQDAQTLVVSPGNIGPVKQGMTSDEIVRLLGQPDWIDKRETTVGPVSHPGAEGKKGIVETLEYGSRGFFITVHPNGPLNISCFNQDLKGRMARDFVGRTQEGIRLGASREEVLKAYGKPEIEQKESFAYVELGWQFMFRHDKLCSIHTNRPMPKRRADGVQTRVLKDGSIISVGPGVDIDAMLDENGNLKKTPPRGFERQSVPTDAGRSK